MNQIVNSGMAYCLLLLCFTEATAAGLAGPARCEKNASISFSKHVWYGKGPDGRTDLMLVAWMADKDGRVRLTGYTLGKQDCASPRKSFDLRGNYVCVLVDVKAYRDPNRHILYAVLTEGGASTGGIWVVGIGGTGSPRTLFQDMSRGAPTFRIRNGIPEVQELWEIGRLMGHGWHPTREFGGHVLVERIYRLGPKGNFELRISRPAVEEERKLPKHEFKRLLTGRQRLRGSGNGEQKQPRYYG